MSNRLDLTGQYLGTVLIPRLNRADEAFNNGDGWRALELLIEVARVLDIQGVRKPELKAKLPGRKKVWLETPGKILELASLFSGVDATATTAKRQRVKNRLGGYFYNKFSIEIWDLLNLVGYFKMGHSGLDLDELDKAKDGERDEDGAEKWDNEPEA